MVELRPNWAKGYNCLSVVHQGLGHHGDAVNDYQKELEIEFNNAAFRSGLANAQAATCKDRFEAENTCVKLFKGGWCGRIISRQRFVCNNQTLWRFSNKDMPEPESMEIHKDKEDNNIPYHKKNCGPKEFDEITERYVISSVTATSN